MFVHRIKGSRVGQYDAVGCVDVRTVRRLGGGEGLVL